MNGSVIIRRNPTSDAISIINQMNERYGVPAEGGGMRGAPAQAPPQAPPPPAYDPPVAPLDPADADRLDVEWAAEEQRILSGSAPGPVATERRLGVPPPAPAPAATPTFGVPQYVDLTESVIVMSDGQRFSIHPSEIAPIREMAFEVMLRGISLYMVKIAKAMGIGETPSGGIKGLSQVPQDAPESGVPPENGDGGRSPVVLPVVHERVREAASGDEALPAVVPSVEGGDSDAPPVEAQLPAPRRRRTRSRPSKSV